MSGFAILIIVVALGMIIGNIMLLKHSAKFSMKSLKQDPIEKLDKTAAQQKVKDKPTDET